MTNNVQDNNFKLDLGGTFAQFSLKVINLLTPRYEWIARAYHSPEDTFKSLLKDDLSDENNDVEECKEQCQDFKSSPNLSKMRQKLLKNY